MHTTILFNLDNSSFTYPTERAVFDEFNGNLAEMPGAIVATYKGEQRTYRELAGLVDRIASRREAWADEERKTTLLMEDPFTILAASLALAKEERPYTVVKPKKDARKLYAALKRKKSGTLLTDSTILDAYSCVALQALGASDKTVRLTGSRPIIKDLDTLPLPNRSLVDYEKYSSFIGQGMVTNSIVLQGTRGCPYNCAYCCRVWEKGHVFRSAEHIYEEVMLYYNLGVRRFVFVDDIFNLNKKNSIRFFEMLIKSNFKGQILFPSGFRADILTEDYVDLIVEAGVVSLALALETASPRLQKLIKKNLDIGKTHRIAEYICSKYPDVILELQTMHGFPTETEEEAMMTLKFIKSLKWVHFPYVHLLKIHSNTDMETLALENGIPQDAINRSKHLAYHEYPETMPFDSNFSMMYRAEFLGDYFLSKERLLALLPRQLEVLTVNEVVQKYNSYLPDRIESYTDLLNTFEITEEELGKIDFFDDSGIAVPELNRKIAGQFDRPTPRDGALKVLFIDLTQYFSKNTTDVLDVVDQPLGLMNVATYLERELPGDINCRVAKSMIDFDSYEELKELIETFDPHMLALRGMTFYKDFFHTTLSAIRSWGITLPIIAGGPYATVDYNLMLKDAKVDLAVIGEGEITITELMRAVIKAGNTLPAEEELEKIVGLAFIPRNDRDRKETAGPREVLPVDLL